MTWLSPEIEKRFLEGEQTLHLQAGINNGMASDNFIECTWMRKGKSRNGVIGNTQQPQTMATWVNSMNAATTLLNDLKYMSDNAQTVQTIHKEESKARMKKDAADRESLRQTLAGCIDPLDPDTHSGGELLNICTGKIAPPDVNVHNALAIGAAQMDEFEASWPEGFYSKLSMKVVTFASKKKHIIVKGKPIMDPEAIYARAIGLLLSDREINFVEIISFELTGYPPAYFREDGALRPATGKSSLRKCIGVTANTRLWGIPRVIIIDFSAFLWTIMWPSHGTLQLVIDEVKKELKEKLKWSDIHLIMDRYWDYSKKSCTRKLREETMTSRPQTLLPNMPNIKKEHVLKCTHNKKQLNKLIYESIINDKDYLKESSRTHKLTVMHDNTVPFMVMKGRKIPRMDLASSHEEADIIIAKHAIICGKEENAKVKVLADDTDIFALLCHFYQAEKITTPLITESPVEGRDAYDIKATVHKEPDVVSKILATHALSGCDTVAATYGIGKVKAVKAAKKHTLTKVGKTESSVEEIVKEGTDFQATCYGCKPVSSMIECRQKQWAQKTGKSSTSAPKLCTLPPTTDAFLQNVLRAHIQLCDWYSTM